MGVVGIASIGCKVSYGTSAESLSPILGVQSIPELGATPEKIETTTLADTVKKTVFGVQDIGDLNFTCLYDTTEFKTVHTALKNGKNIHFKIEFPDGMTATFQAETTIIFNGVEVNGALTYQIACSLLTEITFSLE